MSDKRYHIYISTSYFEEVENETLKLEYALLNLGAFPWQFHEHRNLLNNAVARRQIDDCDIVIFLLGGKYGDLSSSGLSYMQLDFSYALSKQKPMLVFMQASPEKLPLVAQETNPDALKKYVNFRQQLKQDCRYLYEFSNLIDLERHAKLLYSQIIKETKLCGWTRPKVNEFIPSELQRLRQKIAKLEQQLVQVKQESTMVSNGNEAPSHENIQVSYRTHAYQDGNLKEIRLQKSISFAQLLEILTPVFIQPAAEAQFQVTLNQYLDTVALDEVRETMPRAHAVSRTQIDLRSLQQIKLQMKWNNWIIPLHESDSNARVQWQLTPEGQKQSA